MYRSFLIWLIIFQFIGAQSYAISQRASNTYRNSSSYSIKKKPLSEAITNSFNLENLSEERLRTSIEAGHSRFSLALNPNKNPSEVKPEITTSRDGNQVAEIRHKDPTTGKVTYFEIPFNLERTRQYSPNKLIEMAEEAKNSKRPNAALQMAKNFPMEAYSFYYGVGLHALYNLATEAHQNPRALVQFGEMLKDPISHASFAAFIVGNQFGNQAMNGLLRSSLLGGNKLSQAALMRISQHIIPHLSMAIGGLASNLTHDIYKLTKDCAAVKFNFSNEIPSEEATAICNETFEYMFSKDKGYEYVTMISSMVITSFALAGLSYGIKKMGASVTSRFTLKSITLPITRMANFIPVPQVQFLTKLKWVGTGVKFIIPKFKQVHLVAFFELDEEIFHPFFNYNVQKYMHSGPDMMTYESELKKRMGQVRLENIDTESERLTIGEVKKPEPLNFIQRGWNWSVGSFIEPLKANNIEAENMQFTDLLDEYQKSATKWRETITYGFNTSYFNWMGMVSPFNSTIVTTYDFYNRFFDQLTIADEYRRPYDQLTKKHALIHEGVLDNMKLRNSDGSLIDNIENLSVAEQEKKQMNTLALAYCALPILNSIIRPQAEEDFPLSAGRTEMKRHVRVSSLGQNLQRATNELEFLKNYVTCNVSSDTLKDLSLIYMDFLNNEAFQIREGASEVMSQIGNITNEINDIPAEEKEKMRAGLTYLNLFAQKIKSEGMADSLNEKEDILRIFSMVYHYMSAYGEIMPYDRGELFLHMANDYYFENDPDYITKLTDAPTQHLIHQMACSDEDSYSHKRWWGTLHFYPPNIVTHIDENVCDEIVPTSYKTTTYAQLKTHANLGMHEHIDYIANNARESVFSNKTNHFPIWWDENVEPELSLFFNTLNEQYTRNVEKYLIPKIEDEEDTWWDTAKSYSAPGLYFQLLDWRLANRLPPENLVEAFLSPINTYVQTLGQIYNATNSQTSIESWNRINEDLNQSFASLMYIYKEKLKEVEDLKEQSPLSIEEYVEQREELDRRYNIELANRYGNILAHIKKIKSLFLFNDPEIIAETEANPNDNQMVETFKNNLQFYREKLSPANPDLYRKEFINLLEARILDDQYIDEALREHLPTVALKYNWLEPVEFAANIEGDGAKSIQELFNKLMATVEEAYEISKMVNLASDSIYTKALIEIEKERSGSFNWKK